MLRRIVIILITFGFIGILYAEEASDSLDTVAFAKKQVTQMVDYLKHKLDKTIKINKKSNQNYVIPMGPNQGRINTTPASRDSVFWNRVKKLYEKPKTLENQTE